MNPISPTCKGVNQWTKTQWQVCPRRFHCERYLQRTSAAVDHLCPMEGQQYPKEFPHYVAGDPND